MQRIVTREPELASRGGFVLPPDPALAEAAIQQWPMASFDRLVHNGHRIEMRGFDAQESGEAERRSR
jgi:hypothetical protein